MQQWEFTYLQASTLNLVKLHDEANRLGALGWEPVGATSADKTIGLNSNVLIFKRPIESPLPAATSDEEWQDDPSGRFDKRRWDAASGLWSAEVAMMEAKTLHVDPPIASQTPG